MHSALGQYPETEFQLVLLDRQEATRTLLEELLPLQQQYRFSHLRGLDQLRLFSRRHPVDLLLLHWPGDLHQHRRIIEQLRRLCPHSPIIVLDACACETRSELLQAVGASDCLSLETLSGPLLQRAIRYCLRHQRQADQIRQLRLADPLTAVGNRPFLYRQLAARLLQSRKTHRPLALICVDLDGFSQLNRRYGHAAGDAVVRELSQRLRDDLAQDRPVAERDLLARLGGDEFALLLWPPHPQDPVAWLKQRLQQLLSRLAPPYRIAGSDRLLACSIGAALAPQHGGTVDQLLRRAGLAHVAAKQQHGDSYRIYDATMEETPTEPSELEPDIFTALRAEQFVLHYQPRIELRSGRIVGAEALMRWQHPQRGLIMPDRFIPLAERNGLIVPIGYWAIHSAGQALLKLQRCGRLDGRIGVNLSFRQFRDPQLAATIGRIIDQQRIDPQALELELTESALFSDEHHVRRCIEQLHQLGIAFSLDDFGTGYSSFALLQKLPIHTLKIDRSFIRNVTDNPDDAEIVRAIINLAHNLEMVVIAEGVETEAQLKFLQRHGCDQVQGFLFSPAVPLERFEQMLVRGLPGSA